MKKLLILPISMVACGCASVKSIDGAVLNSLTKYSGSEVTVPKRDVPEFEIMTAGSVGVGALFGPIGAVAASMARYSDGQRFLIGNHVDDPAYAIASKVSDGLSKYGVSQASFSDEITSSDDAEDISKKYQSPLVLDVKTNNWRVIYYPMSWSTYGVRYSATVRLIDTKTNEVVIDGSCEIKPEKTEDSPSYDEMFGGGAQRLKSEMSKIVDMCVQQLSII